MINPLTKRKGDETLYTRPPAIDAQLHLLSGLSRDELLQRAQVPNRKDPQYVPSECLVYFIRASRKDNNDAWFERLYKILVERVRRSVPKVGSDGDTISLTNETIRNAVFDRFVEMLAEDRKIPDDKLDFFETRFDLAIKRLRLDAQDKAWREQNRNEALEDAQSGEITAAAEAAAGQVNPLDDDLFSDPLFRDRLYKAIDGLPPEQSRTMHLLLMGWPIDSKDPEAMTIAKALDCSDRSVRNYRDRALAALKAHFKSGDDQ